MADQRYWDSTVFFAWLADQHDAQEQCARIIRRAEEGEIEIVTSALAIAEVLWLPDKPPPDPKNRGEIRRFFQHDYIIPVEIDRRTALRAQDLVWDYDEVKPKDALHLASALVAEVPVFDTFDEPLQKLDGKIGNPPLRIGEPYVEPRSEDLQEDFWEEDQEPA